MGETMTYEEALKTSDRINSGPDYPRVWAEILHLFTPSGKPFWRVVRRERQTKKAPPAGEG